jgi:hypothetical protein
MALEITEDMKELFVRSGDASKPVALAAQQEIAKAIELPLRQGVQSGDVTGGIFIPITDGTQEFPTDLLAPGTEGQFVAYTNPGHGYIPQKSVESDYVRVTSYQIASSIDFLLRYAKNANWNILDRAMEVMEMSFVKKINDDAWHTLLAAAVDRNILVYDADAANGQITKRLFSLVKTSMKRNAGGNGPTNRGRATDCYLSIEGIEDIRNWGIDQLDEVSRREVYVSADGGAPLTRIYGLNLHDMFEFGDGQEYQDYFLSDLGGSLASGDVELGIALDLQNRNSFVMPVTDQLQVFEDDTLHRQQRQGYYGWMGAGFGVLDGRRILAFSF